VDQRDERDIKKFIFLKKKKKEKTSRSYFSADLQVGWVEEALRVWSFLFLVF